MDPVTDLPPMTVDHAGDPTPPITGQPPHPPYAEMINSTITALNDRDGSSRQAISKYIEKEYPNLPPTHSVLLTHHLKRLKNLGQLIMVKHSYMLPTGNTNVENVGNVDNVNANLENSPLSGTTSKRKPGRPPKLKPVTGLGQMPNDPQFPYNVGGVVQDVVTTDGSGLEYQGNSMAEPLFASLGLGDDGVAVPSPLPNDDTPAVAKRGRGRPPKSGGGGGGGGGGRGRGRPLKKRRGRVPKASGDVAGEGGGGSEGVERDVKNQKMMSVMGGRVTKGRGRPRRIGIGAITVPLSGNLLMPRPKRVAKPTVAVNGAVGETVPGSKRPARRFTGKRVVKARKGENGTAVIVTDPQQLVVYKELKTKYDLLQSKVKQVASMVRPCIHPEFGITALGALQELEALAGVVQLDNGQTQEPDTAPLPLN